MGRPMGLPQGQATELRLPTDIAGILGKLY